MTPKEILLRAKEAIDSNDLLLANELYTKILNKFPSHLAAKKGLKKIKNLTNISHNNTNKDSLDEAINELHKGQFQKAINISLNFKLTNPQNPIVYNLIGISYVNLQKPQEAITYFQTAIRLNKHYSEAKANLGSALLLIGKVEEAILQLEDSIKENSKNAMAWNSLGNAFTQQDNLKSARKAFEKAIALSPNYLNAINSLGVLLNNLEKRKEALDTFEKGLKINPNDTDILTNLGYTLADSGNIPDAIKALSKVIASKHYNIDVKHRLGVLKSNSGQIKEAITTLLEVIDEDPKLSEAYRSLSLIYQFKTADPLITKMQTLLNHPKATNYDKTHLGFAIGKSLHDTRKYDKAFQAYKIGNSTRRLELSFDSEEHRSSIEKIKSTNLNFKLDFQRDEKISPIFIVGMNRSGTTLVEQILSSHSEVYGGGELSYINKMGLKNLQSEIEWNSETLKKVRQEYIGILNSFKNDEQYVTDKLPVNFKWIGLIKQLFPNAKIIHMIRNPMDTCLSNYRNYFIASGNAYAYDLKELANFFIDYRNIMEFWHKKFPAEIYACNYDILTFNQEEESKMLLKYCGLEWQDEVLRFEKNKRSVKTASVGQIRQGLYQTSVGNWEKYKQGMKPLYEILKSSGCLDDWDKTHFA